MSADHPTFYYDVGSPYAYLAAERLASVFAQPLVWQPILLGALFKIHQRDSWANGPGRDKGMREVERRAVEYGLPAIKWPGLWPGNTLFAMRAATFANQIGKGIPFSIAAFRQAYAGGRDLSDPDNVLIAAAACELHPNALTKAVGTQAVKDELRAATEVAAARGVIGVPSVAVGDQVFWGDDQLDRAGAAAA